MRLAFASSFGLHLAVAAVALHGAQQPVPQLPPFTSQASSAADVRQTLKTYCVTCHNQKANTAKLALDTLDVEHPETNAATWEKVVQKLRAQTMPPEGSPRPTAAAYSAVALWLESSLDRAWAANPNPGRISAVHRLNRREYQNAVRDLLHVDVDVKSMLPPDSSADGSFDNMANVLTISPAHFDRYMSAARQVTRLAVGLPPSAPESAEFGLPRDHLQEDLINTDLPLGSRGGIAARYHFPVDGEYTIRVFLHRNYQDYVIGMGWPQLLDVRLDGKLVKRFTVGGGALGFRSPALGFAGDGEPGFEGDREWEDYTLTKADADLQIRTFVKSGPGIVGVSFPRDLFEIDGVGNPGYGATGEYLLSEQHLAPARVAEVRIVGPHVLRDGIAKDSPNRRVIFICEPKTAGQERSCASRILSRLARRAYRRPVTDRDVDPLLSFFDLGRNDGGTFDAGIQMALERLLVDPDFLLRVYQDPDARSSRPVGRDLSRAPQPSSESSYPLSDLEVASRLSFFLWSSIPDDTLLKVAESGKLTQRVVLREQVRRMFADGRATDALVKNFIAQWLNLRRMDEYTPDYGNIRDAGRALLHAFPIESEMFVASTLREDRPVADLLSADYTFVNETLARHYGIPNVYGSHFRRVKLPNLDERGGLLAHGGVLALTSYPDRTSPVLRGKWLLDNILDAPVPPPPNDVNTTLEETTAQAPMTSIRERLAQHRNQARCSVCHSVMDPLGFALERFDAVGRRRDVDETGKPIDDIGHWPGGAKLAGLAGLRSMLMDRREQFVATVTRKLMSYALGRELEHYDQPAVRKIVRDAVADGYRWSSIISGIVESPAFLMRTRAN